MFLFLSVPAMGSLYCFHPLPFLFLSSFGLTQGASKLMNERQMLGVRDLVQCKDAAVWDGRMGRGRKRNRSQGWGRGSVLTGMNGGDGGMGEGWEGINK